MIPRGFCQCGCGQRTSLALQTSTARGNIKGEPVRFRPGHQRGLAHVLSPNPSGLCQCGCGGRAPLATQTNTLHGTVKGEPRRFIAGHQSNGKNHGRWRGGRIRREDGYVLVHAPDHPNADAKGYILEHVLIASRALGKPLPCRSEVHHVDKDPSNNRRGNLVICEDHSYHALLHVRARALNASGNPSYRKCDVCKQWDDPVNLVRTARHRACQNAYQRSRRAQKRIRAA
jgi:hypothetical protein